MPDEREWSLALGNATVLPRKNWGSLFGPDKVNQQKLREAIPLAQKMVLAALIGLRKTELHLKTLRPGTLADPDAHPDDVKQVFVTVAKFFSLTPGNRQYARHLGGIITVFDLVRNGLMSPFDIVVFHPDTIDQPGYQGYVTSRGTRVTQPASPIRMIFGFTDQDNHLPWQGGLDRGRIHLSLEIVNSNNAADDAEELARIIVHEATHRFARTHDVLYRHQSWAMQRRKGTLDDESYQMMQPTLRLPMVPGKSITSMAGFDKAGDDIADVRWLENADSYAWTARRLRRKYRA